MSERQGRGQRGAGSGNSVQGGPFKGLQGGQRAAVYKAEKLA